MHLSRQATEVKQGVIITNKNLQFHFKGHNNDLLVLKQWKGAFNRIMNSPFSLLLPLLCKKASGSSIILYIITLHLYVMYY